MGEMKASRRAVRVVGGVASVILVLTACGGGGSPGTSTSGGTGGAGGAPSTGGSSTTSSSTGGSSTGNACGNGVIDPQETCDTAIAAGASGACPTACDDGASCTKDSVAGAGTCKAVCSHEVITACVSGDGCCPSSCTHATDTDCSQTCGDGALDAGEQCDTAIAAGQPGSCPTSCDDGFACTTDTLLNAGTCAAECTHAQITACVDGDGCCPLGCPSDTDCTPLSRIRQTVITDSGQTNWYRNGYWNGTAYADWTSFSGQGMAELVPAIGGTNQTFRGIDHVVLGDGRLKQTVLQMDGKKAWYRYGTWDGSAYSSWTDWTDQYGDLTQWIPGQQAYRSFDHVVFPDGRIKQTLLTFDGKTIWYRYADWNGTSYANWTAWSNQGGDVTQWIPGHQSFRSFNHVLLADKRMKQALLSEDGRTVFRRYGTWDGTKYSTWSAWTSQWGDLTGLLPGQGSNQAYLAWDEGALMGTGVATGCQNGCDDGDPCTVDSCAGNACLHVAISCDDGDGCTADTCANGVCQHGPISCDDGDACTTDVCVGGACQHNAMSCDDGNGCTDDWCSGGACQHGNNTAPCAGGQCQNGSCQATTCQCNGCKDTCGNACNQGAVCASNATCQAGTCACTNLVCGGGCCAAGDTCSGGQCCPTAQSAICAGKCGGVQGPCGVVNCGGCNGAWLCCPGLNVCDEFCP